MTVAAVPGAQAATCPGSATATSEAGAGERCQLDDGHVVGRGAGIVVGVDVEPNGADPLPSDPQVVGPDQRVDALGPVVHHAVRRGEDEIGADQ